jgi:hypothetical protein
MLNRIRYWQAKKRRAKDLLLAAETFCDQYNFTGHEGLIEGECNYAITMLLTAYNQRLPVGPWNQRTGG